MLQERGEVGDGFRGERVLKLLSVIYDKCNLFTTRCSFIQDKLFASLPTQLHGKLLAGLTGVWLMGPPSNYQVRWQQTTRQRQRQQEGSRQAKKRQGKKEKGGKQGKQTTLYVKNFCTSNS